MKYHIGFRVPLLILLLFVLLVGLLSCKKKNQTNETTTPPSSASVPPGSSAPYGSETYAPSETGSNITAAFTVYDYAFASLPENLTVVVAEGLGSSPYTITWAELFFTLSSVAGEYLSGGSGSFSRFYSDKEERDTILDKAVREYLRLAVYEAAASDAGFSLDDEQIRAVAEYHENYKAYYLTVYDQDFDDVIWKYYRLTPDVFDKQNYLNALRRYFLENMFSAELAASEMTDDEIKAAYSVEGDITDEQLSELHREVHETALDELSADFSDSMDEIAGSATYKITGGLEDLDLAVIFDEAHAAQTFSYNS